MSKALEELKNVAKNMSFEEQMEAAHQLYNYVNEDDEFEEEWSQTSWERGDDETDEDYDDRMEDLDNYLEGSLDD